LFLAIGGVGAYAASKIGSKEIKRGAIKAKHLKADAVRTKHIAAAQVGTDELAPASVGSEELLAGSVGAGKLDLVASDELSGPLQVSGPGSDPLEASVTVEVPQGGAVLFELSADVATDNSGTGCRAAIATGAFSVDLLDLDLNQGDPAQPYSSGLIVTYPPDSGQRVFELRGTVNGIVAGTCTWSNLRLHAISLG
jgi:hypothetical protein